ncbi:SGT1 protein-domain-containing protein [Irpex rosettiformis]|uniref:SGT1 protein-domain-containing protein n=1 Tax=Irpex rosettiformis TaxID=378272 RepID=A0ACB8UJL9_9APHY|nr:SGT1 protein-domain-containing protein [Irpex rosettiformis]
MDVFNRPPAISEDTLFYELYLPETMSDKASATTLAVVMQDYAESLIPDMQWHRDAFELKVNRNHDSGTCMLEGTMRVGDCVDDEWCTVWILREISNKWDVAIRVFDTDGEFLLIEAADHLPDWVTPSNAVNRVWLYNSHIHLIPLSHISAANAKEQYRRYNLSYQGEGEDHTLDDLEEFLSAQDANMVLRDLLANTRVSDNVENTIWKRISGYPDAVRSHVHHTSVVVPIDVARALSVRPALVQKAVETFYTRDALQLRAAHRMSRFPPDALVKCTVKMTRTAYAQLIVQKFYPPKVFGRFEEREGTSEWRRRDTGMKIACGFEMLYQETKGRSSQLSTAEMMAAANIARREALRNNPDYRKFISNLQNSGYFKKELEGSKLWTELEDKAAAAFVEARHVDDATRPSFSTQVESAITIAGVVFPEQPEDPDDWLTIDVDNFDALLTKIQGQVTSGTREAESEETELANEQASHLKSLAQKVEEFVEGEGDIEGARFADELLSDESSDSDAEEEGGDDDVPIEAESPDQRREKRQAALDALVPGLEPSEYGQMPPSFHRNSQRVARGNQTSEQPDTSASNLAQDGPASVRAPLLTRDKYEGVDSDDESDEDEDDEEGDEDDERPQLVGDIDVDMSEEQEEFLEFARQVLGMSDQQWNDIVDERRDRGAFVPKSAIGSKPSDSGGVPVFAKTENGTPSLRGSTKPKPNLGSFEELMRAMDAELSRSRASQGKSGHTSTNVDKDKSKATIETLEEEGDIESAMEAELKELLEHNGDEDEDLEGGMGIDYNLIKNFLESFKGQAGLSGPVGNLAGRLQPDWSLPRDSS